MMKFIISHSSFIIDSGRGMIPAHGACGASASFAPRGVGHVAKSWPARVLRAPGIWRTEKQPEYQPRSLGIS